MNETFNPMDCAKANMATAIDQQHDHPSLKDALESYFDNLRDTCHEYRAEQYAQRDAEEWYLSEQRRLLG